MSLYLGKNKIASGGFGTSAENADESIVNELKINYLTETQYLNAKENNELNSKELYMTPDDKVVFDYTFPNSNQSEILFLVNLKPNEQYKIRISGGVANASDIYLEVNDIKNGYYQLGQYLDGNLSDDGNLNNVTGYRANKAAFYYAHTLKKDISVIEGVLSLEYSPTQEKYYPVYNWKSFCSLNTQQMLSNATGILVSPVNEITKLKFSTNGNKFLKGTRIFITKEEV